MAQVREEMPEEIRHKKIETIWHPYCIHRGEGHHCQGCPFDKTKLCGVPAGELTDADYREAARILGIL